MVETVEDVAFPSFDQTQMEAVASIAECIQFGPGDTLIAKGDKDFPFYVIKSGEVRIVEPHIDDERLIATHGPGAFTGDVDMLTGRTAVISAIANGPVEAFRLCAVRLRRLMHQCPKFSDTLLNAFQRRRELLEASPFIGVRLVGNPETRGSAKLREFFYKNHVPYTFFDASTEVGQSQLTELSATDMPLPVVHCNGKTIGNPTLKGLAECIGISHDVQNELFDLVIVGSGPAGLAASVYAASEKIKTLVVDSLGPGGQAASSSRIENFIGFPSGLSGSELANRGYLQALKFGARFIAPVSVESIQKDESDLFHLQMSDQQAVRAKAVLVATGVSYRQLDVTGCHELEGAGVYYAATSVEAIVCEERNAVVIGGGNSAGQAAMFLANTAAKVTVMIRGGDLAKSMSGYLCERIENHPRIEVLKYSELDCVEGDQSLKSMVVRNNQTGATQRIDCSGVFIFIGAKPHTDWLPDEVLLDEKGFVMTGASVESAGDWPLERAPCDLETSVPGIFAAGDVRSGTTKRCGFAVGDGSLAIACIHRYFAFG